MRALLFLVAGLVLAACTSSPIPSSNAQMSNGGSRLMHPSVSPGRIRLEFSNAIPSFRVLMTAIPMVCVRPMVPHSLMLEYGQRSPVDIQTDPQCRIDRPELDFLVDARSIASHSEWHGDLDLWYDTHSGEWHGKLGGYGTSKLCTYPALSPFERVPDGAHIELTDKNC